MSLRDENSTPYVQKRDLQHIPRRSQTQRALSKQLLDLIAVANRLGLYDAADFIRGVCNESS